MSARCRHAGSLLPYTQHTVPFSAVTCACGWAFTPDPADGITGRWPTHDAGRPWPMAQTQPIKGPDTTMTIREQAAEVLRLDGLASPGPWDAEYVYRALRHVENNTDLAEAYNDEKIPRVRDNDADAPLIATYRTMAPVLAAEVVRLTAEIALLKEVQW